MVVDYKSLDDIITELNLSNNIIINDFDAWMQIPKYRKIYNKLDLALNQNIECGPIGIYPNKYPIVIKPIINLYGMSRGFKIINTKEEYKNNLNDGHFWMTYFSGKQINIDFIILNGKIKYYLALFSKDNNDGTFEYHEYLPKYKLTNKIKAWIKSNLKGYTGCLNIECIDDNIIEAHLRLNGDFYGYDLNFVRELDKLYTFKTWTLNSLKKKKYLFPIFVNNNINMFKIDIDTILKLCENYNVISFRIDNINSEYQKKGISRLFMFDINNFEKGIELKKLILLLIVNN